VARLAQIGRLRPLTLPLALAALVLDASDAKSVSAVGRRLRFTNKERQRAAWLIEQLPTVVRAAQTPWPQLQRVLIHEGATELVDLLESITDPTDASLALCRERLTWPAERLNPAPLVDGAALIRHGLRPGPDFSAILERIRDAQLNGEINSTEEALALVDRLR
jgi:hypothetical protein